MSGIRRSKCPALRRWIFSMLPCAAVLVMTLLCNHAYGQMIIDGIVAVVDDKVIMHSDLLKKMRELGAPGYEANAARQVLQIMIEDVIVDKVYKGMGLQRIDLKQAEQVSKDMNVDIVSAQSIIKRNSLMEMMVKSRVVITETMIKDHYDKEKEYSGSESLHLKQILIKKDRLKAEKAMEDLKKAVPFDEVAKAYSDVMPGNSPDIGWIAIQDLAAEARPALTSAKKGDYVGPLELGENILIFQLLDRGVSGGRQLEEARSEIVEKLQDKYRREAFEHWLRMIMAEHYIGIYM